MKFATLSMFTRGFTGFAMSQGTGTTLTTATCINPRSCRGTPIRSNIYTLKTTDSMDLTRTITDFRR
jgi:methionine aminopeptidase